MYPPPSYTNNGFKEQPYPPDFPNQPPSYPPPYYTPPEPMPAQPQAHSVVITTEQYVVAVPQHRYRDYMALSILTLIFFCSPLGLAAILFSSKSRDALRRGDPMLAAQYSRTAHTLNIVAIVLGICFHVIWVTCVIYFTSTSSSSSNYVYVYG